MNILMVAVKKKPVRKPTPKAILDIPDRIVEAMDHFRWPERGRQSRLAKVSSLSEGQVSALLSKERAKGIQAALVLRIADGLKINAGWLLTGRGDMLSGAPPEIDLRALVREEVEAAVKKTKGD